MNCAICVSESDKLVQCIDCDRAICSMCLALNEEEDGENVCSECDEDSVINTPLIIDSDFDEEDDEAYGIDEEEL